MSRLLNAPKDGDCVGCAGLYAVEEGAGAVDARRSMRFGLAAATAGTAANDGVVVVAVARGETGAAWKSAKSSSALPTVTYP